MVFLVATVTFAVVRGLPGNPVDVYVEGLEGSGLTYQAAQARASSLLNIDLSAPVSAQYVEFLGNLAKGDLGDSVALSPGTPVLGMIWSRLPWTLLTVGVGMTLGFVLGLRLGVLAAYRRGGALDASLSNAGALLDSIPPVVPGVLLVFLLGVVWKVVPLDLLRGAYSTTAPPGWNLPFVAGALAHSAAPIAVYVVTSVGGWMLAMRSAAVSVLSEEYVLNARARGLGSRRIRTAYVERNARLPLVTGFAISFGFVLSGSVLIESIFVYPGLGQLLATAIARRDYTVMQGIVIVTTLAVLLTTAIADALHGWLDPRVRLGELRR